MPTIDELLDENAGIETIDETGFIYDDKYRRMAYEDSQVIRIQNKTIAGLQNQVTVKGEINSQYISFEHERYMDGIDLTNMIIQIHYKLNDEYENNSSVVNVQYSDTSIVFGWLIPRNITENGGRIMFMPFFFGDSPDGEPYLLKDLYTTYIIRDGLSIEDGIEEPAEESWYQQFLSDILALRQYTNEAALSAEQAEEAQSLAKQYMEQTRQLSVTNVGNLEFFINAEKKCLSVNYNE